MATGSSSRSRDIVMINWVIYDEGSMIITIIMLLFLLFFPVFLFRVNDCFIVLNFLN